MSKQDATVTISSFTIGDYDEAYALWQRCEGIGLSSADSRPNIAAYLARNPGTSFAAKSEAKIVGALLCGHDGRRGYIHHLAVSESFRRQGIGRNLVKQALTALNKEGIQKCHLFIFHENEAGIAFWRSIGWIFRQEVRIMSTYIEEGTLRE